MARTHQEELEFAKMKGAWLAIGGVIERCKFGAKGNGKVGSWSGLKAQQRLRAKASARGAKYLRQRRVEALRKEPWC